MQALLNAMANFGSISAFSLAFFFQYRMFRYFDLSAGANFAAGAYVFCALIAAGHAAIPAILGAVAVSALIGLAVTGCIVRPLAKLGASALDLTLGSLGLYIIGVNVVALLFGDELQRPSGLGVAAPFAVYGGIITGAQLSLLLVALLSFAAVAVVLRATAMGRAFRALGENSVLAQDLGLSVHRAMLFATAAGAGLMGVGGALVAADLGVRPTTAFPYMLPGLAAVLAFGGRTITQVLFGACVVTITGELGGRLFGQQWREFAIFSIVALFLTGRARLFVAVR